MTFIVKSALQLLLFLIDLKTFLFRFKQNINRIVGQYCKHVLGFGTVTI